MEGLRAASSFRCLPFSGSTHRPSRHRADRPGLAARGESLAAFDGRCIPKPPQRGCRVGGPGAGCVAPRSNTPGILGRRALPAGRLARLGATPDFHHGLLEDNRHGSCRILGSRLATALLGRRARPKVSKLVAVDIAACRTDDPRVDSKTGTIADDDFTRSSRSKVKKGHGKE